MHPDVAKLVEAGRISDEVGTRLSELAPGKFCLHKNWGAGKILSWELAVGKLVIDFEQNEGQRHVPRDEWQMNGGACEVKWIEKSPHVWHEL